MEKKYIINFIYKFFFILRAASDGYIIRYLGDNKYEFIGTVEKYDNERFIQNCTKNLPNFLLYK